MVIDDVVVVMLVILIGDAVCLSRWCKFHWCVMQVFMQVPMVIEAETEMGDIRSRQKIQLETKNWRRQINKEDRWELGFAARFSC